MQARRVWDGGGRSKSHFREEGEEWVDMTQTTILFQEGWLKYSSQSQLAEAFLPTGVPALGCSWLFLPFTLWALGGTCHPAPK